jgi:hypothetical protein
VRQVFQGLPNHINSLIRCKEKVFAGGIEDRHHQLIKKQSGAAGYVNVPVGDRVKTCWV